MKKMNENNVKEAMNKMMESLDAPSVKTVRCSFLPSLEYANFTDNVELVEAMDKLDALISSYKLLTDENERKEYRALLGERVNDVNKIYKVLQVNAMKLEGSRSYVAAPFFKAVNVKFDKDGNFKDKDFVKRPMLPADMPEGFFSGDFAAKSKVVMKACLGCAGDLVLHDADGNAIVKTSKSAIKEYMTDALKTVLGEDCHFQVRGKDVDAMRLSCVSRVSYLSTTFKKTKEDMFAWYLVDSFGSALHGTSYTVK